MRIDTNFWKTRAGVEPDPAAVYQAACCEQKDVPGLEALPVTEILAAAAAAFPDWNAVGQGHYEKQDGPGAFEAAATRQAVRFDCYGMEPAEIKRLTAVMAGFGCPLYDPQLGVRFDKIDLFLVDEAGDYRAKKQTKVTAFLQFGRAWTSRPCPCKNDRLADGEARVLGELVQKSIGRAVDDLLARSYYVP